MDSSNSRDDCSLTRRGWFERMTGGLCGTALAYLFRNEFGARFAAFAAEPREPMPGVGPTYDLKPRAPHFAAKAKAVIQLFMNGGPSQVDLFDPKPMLDKHHGESYFDKIAGEVENVNAAGSILRSPFKFAQHGKSGMWLSELLPHLAKQADNLAVIRSMFTTNITHEPALYLIHSGQMRAGYPCLGSWVIYGLGTENQNLPAYVVLADPAGLPVNGVENWNAGFLPPIFQGTPFRPTGAPILNLHPAKQDAPAVSQFARDFLARLDRTHESARPFQPRLAARIASYELAARMQLAADEALDLSKESSGTLQLYGVGRQPTDSYGRRCLIARRLVERGVRFVQIFINGQIWDHHTGIAAGLKSASERTDQPVAALLRDLKQRGLLESTLVLWGGEFGRLPIAQLPDDKSEQNAGRDHNKNAFTTWMAGAGIKGGTVFGATDELGLAAVENRVSVPDWHATILHLLGMNHEELFFERNGLKDRLTGVTDARVVEAILS
ncbi:MAG: DUF1501 domain-containing protein [Verrucomicrobia bacterium]|nr:DUF1501 domain-containing protein [Verrucomicrobiota bacterium]